MNRMIFLSLITIYGIIGYCEAGTDSSSQTTSSESNAFAPPSYATVGVNSMSSQKVALNSPDKATIYYSTDGNDPSVPEPCGSSATDTTQIYTAPILLLQTTTLKAVACKTGETNSQVASKTYTKMQNESSYQEVTGFGSNPGGLIMVRYIPSNVWENSGLVVVLHGCGMSAEAMKGGMAWNELAEKYNFM